MTLPYRQAGITFSLGKAGPHDLVQALQKDLRRLGYLRQGIDGVFGPETERAVRALQDDLLFNDGRGADGRAPVALCELNGGRVRAVNGIADEALAACLEDLLGDSRIPALPRSDDPETDNARILGAIRSLGHPPVPIPFLLGILSQESNLLHFRRPKPDDPDDFIVVGCDCNDRAHPDRITSRGYGVGQFTLFHHPPTGDDVAAVMLDPVKNVERAISELHEKFDVFVVGMTSETRADDRIAAVGHGPLRPCRYEASDSRYQTDCRQCALEAPRMRLAENAPVYPGAAEHLEPTRYHHQTHYDDLPDWNAFGCDWPYAVRRYNGSGVNSYHYQAEVLGRFLHDTGLALLLEQA